MSKTITDFLTSYGRRKNYQDGQTIAVEGDMSRDVYIVLDGEVEILKLDENNNQNVIARVGQGTILGEMGVFLDQKRTGTIRTATDTTMLEFSNENFLAALSRLPELSQRIFKSLSTKIVKANETLVEQSTNQNLLTVGVALLELKPAVVRRTTTGGEEDTIVVHPTDMSEDTGIERKIIRSTIELFKQKRLISSSSISHDGSISMTLNFQALTQYLKGLVNHVSPSSRKSETADNIPVASERENAARNQLPSKKGYGS
ncbi:MAG: cyclic nucleotide-binding domain-containing protein [Gammaproteobacteria bacterium]|nr:cyclic nucleotide-binding domain-containing protein [Gammaproteobacteria bacterium]